MYKEFMKLILFISYKKVYEWLFFKNVNYKYILLVLFLTIIHSYIYSSSIANWCSIYHVYSNNRSYKLSSFPFSKHTENEGGTIVVESRKEKGKIYDFTVKDYPLSGFPPYISDDGELVYIYSYSEHLKFNFRKTENHFDEYYILRVYKHGIEQDSWRIDKYVFENKFICDTLYLKTSKDYYLVLNFKNKIIIDTLQINNIIASKFDKKKNVKYDEISICKFNFYEKKEENDFEEYLLNYINKYNYIRDFKEKAVFYLYGDGSIVLYYGPIDTVKTNILIEACSKYKFKKVKFRRYQEKILFSIVW